MVNKKRLLKTIAFGIISASLVLLIMLYYSGKLLSSPGLSTRVNSTGEENINEDQISIYTMPNDVSQAFNQSKSLGLPVMGIRTDGPSYHIPILMYHYVEYVKDRNDKIRISLNTPPEILDNEIQTLIKANYTFISASDLANILDGIETAPAKPVMLTFDDGHRDFYTDAFPILKKYRIKATEYVISGFLNQPDFLTDNQLQEIAKNGLVEIGAHTVKHIALQGKTKSEVEGEITGSKIQLELKIGSSITAFAYPYGSFDLNAVQLVKQSGFRTAVSTLPGTEVTNGTRFFAFRLRPGGRIGAEFLTWLESQK